LRVFLEVMAQVGVTKEKTNNGTKEKDTYQAKGKWLAA
jgi:hypothetical protein